MAILLERFANIAQRRKGLARLAVTAVLLVVSTMGNAVTPLSPRLDDKSRMALTQALLKGGISETESSAVLISLLAVLGQRPATRLYRYREPYPQLPDVDAKASAVDAACVSVLLSTRPKAGPRQSFAIQGAYCLIDTETFVWGAREISRE